MTAIFQKSVLRDEDYSNRNIYQLMTLTLTDQSYLKQPREAKFSASKTRTWKSLFAVMTLNDPLQK